MNKSEIILNVIKGAKLKPNFNRNKLSQELCRTMPETFKGQEKTRRLVSIVANNYFVTKEKNIKGETVLAFSCLHCPVEHPESYEFLKEIKREYKPTTIVNLGDTFDVATPSRHGGNPDIYSASDEIKKAKKHIRKFVDLFPEMLVCESNHTQRYYRQAKFAGLPMEVMRTINDIYELPETWVFDTEHIVNKVLYRHGHGSSSAFTNACHGGHSFVQGHKHSVFDCQYTSSKFNCIFGVTAGALCNPDAETMKYGIYGKARPVLGCAIIENGEDVKLIRMKL